ncbi:MAG TPA: hypothetical protein ENJ82_14410, partial [Bacteroidetes bacterium]|nr:hypothetical protein [Bacteroidota bacterium]
MKLRNLLLSIFCLLITGSGLQAQYGLHLGQFSSRIWSQRYQPANITQGDFATFRYGAHGGLYLGNSQASLDGILVKGGFITEGVKDRIINELGEGEVLNGGFDLGVASVNVKFGESNQVWGFYIEDRLDAVAGFDNPNTFGLIMKGNGPYAGEMVADNGVFARVLGSRKIGVGTGWQFDKLNFGARINFVQGQRMLDLDHLNYELFTSTLGTKLDLKADYALNATEKFSGIGLFGMQGYGGSVDLGVTYALNEKIVLEGSVLDLGATVWKTQKLADQIDLEWEGVFITSLFEDSIPEILEREVAR